MCALIQTLRLCTGRTAHRGSRCIALLIHDHGTRRGWGVSVTPRPLFTPEEDQVPILQETGWAPGPVWTGTENLAPTGIRSPDRPARSQSLYRLSYPAHGWGRVEIYIFPSVIFYVWLTFFWVFFPRSFWNLLPRSPVVVVQLLLAMKLIATEIYQYHILLFCCWRNTCILFVLLWIFPSANLASFVSQPTAGVSNELPTWQIQAFLDIMPCCLVCADVSEELAAFKFRVWTLPGLQAEISTKQIDTTSHARTRGT